MIDCTDSIQAGDERLHCCGFAKLEGSDFVFYIRKFEITLGRKSSSGSADVLLGDNMNLSRCHAKIVFNFAAGAFQLTVLGKNGVEVDGILYTPTSEPLNLISQMRIHMGDKTFWFLLPAKLPRNHSDAVSAPGLPSSLIPRERKSEDPQSQTEMSSKPLQLQQQLQQHLQQQQQQQHQQQQQQQQQQQWQWQPRKGEGEGQQAKGKLHQPFVLEQIGSNQGQASSGRTLSQQGVSQPQCVEPNAREQQQPLNLEPTQQQPCQQQPGQQQADLQQQQQQQQDDQQQQKQLVQAGADVSTQLTHSMMYPGKQVGDDLQLQEAEKTLQQQQLQQGETQPMDVIHALTVQEMVQAKAAPQLLEQSLVTLQQGNPSVGSKQQQQQQQQQQQHRAPVQPLDRIQRSGMHGDSLQANPQRPIVQTPSLQQQTHGELPLVQSASHTLPDLERHGSLAAASAAVALPLDLLKSRQQPTSMQITTEAATANRYNLELQQQQMQQQQMQQQQMQASDVPAAQSLVLNQQQQISIAGQLQQCDSDTGLQDIFIQQQIRRQQQLQHQQLTQQQDQPVQQVGGFGASAGGVAGLSLELQRQLAALTPEQRQQVLQLHHMHRLQQQQQRVQQMQGAPAPGSTVRLHDAALAQSPAASLQLPSGPTRTAAVVSLQEPALQLHHTANATSTQMFTPHMQPPAVSMQLPAITFSSGIDAPPGGFVPNRRQPSVLQQAIAAQAQLPQEHRPCQPAQGPSQSSPAQQIPTNKIPAQY